MPVGIPLSDAEVTCPHCELVVPMGTKNRRVVFERHVSACSAKPAGGDGATRSPSGEAQPDPAPADSGEDHPSPSRPGLRDRIRSRLGGKSEKTRRGPESPGAERPPKRSRGGGRRVPLDEDLSEIWAGVGEWLEATPHYPTGRMLQYQALGAGIIIDSAVAGTLPDRLFLQPLARQKDRWEDVAFMVVPPLFTMAMTNLATEIDLAQREADHERVATLVAQARMQARGFDWMVRRMLVRLAPAIAKAREKQERTAAAVAEAFPELAEAGVDPVEALRSMLFAPPSHPGRPSAHEEERNGNQGNTGRPDGAGGDRQAGAMAL